MGSEGREWRGGERTQKLSYSVEHAQVIIRQLAKCEEVRSFLPVHRTAIYISLAAPSHQKETPAKKKMCTEPTRLLFSNMEEAAVC